MDLIHLTINAVEEKLNQLSHDDKPSWGQMNATQMLNHLLLITRISTSKTLVSFSGKIEWKDKLKEILWSNEPFPKEFAAPNQITELNKELNFDFETAKELLIKELELFLNCDWSPEMTITNAVFGELNKEEWTHFHRKHYSHHLAQFGLWEYNIS